MTDPTGLYTYNLDWNDWKSHTQKKTWGARGSFRWEIAWETKGKYNKSKKNGKHYIVQRITWIGQILDCATATPQQYVSHFEYLEAWKIKFISKGVWYKAENDENHTIENDLFRIGPLPGNYGNVSIRGEAIWVKEWGPSYWSRQAVGAANGLLATPNIASWPKYTNASKRSNAKIRGFIDVGSFSCCP